ncbi:MAG: hypothetical protein QOE05_1503 [Actinomycetota bacterium]|jgi:hypothetical protein|nr:hypothetical protein [Actinomycetota bacterium]
MTWQVMDFAHSSRCPGRTYDSWRHPVTALTTTSATTAEDRLRSVLRLDAVVTGAAGLFALLGPGSTYGDVEGWIPRTLGALFVLAALVVAVESRTSGRTLRLIGTLTADAAFAWTVASIAILLLVDLPAKGEAVVALVGLATLLFGIVETRLVRAFGS